MLHKPAKVNAKKLHFAPSKACQLLTQSVELIHQLCFAPWHLVETRNTDLGYVFSHVSTETRYNQPFHRSAMILRVDIAYVSFFESLLGVLQLELLA